MITIFEMLHSLHKQNNGDKGFMAVKLDISKAYDRVEWVFIEKVKYKMGFSRKWAELAMDCISMVHFTFFINRSS